MQIKPILAALRHHKAGTILVALQIALTLAIVCNALFIIRQRLVHLSEPSGVDEASLFVIYNGWADQAATMQFDAQVRTDLAALRQLPSVRNAAPASSCPLCGDGDDVPVMLAPDQTQWIADPAMYAGDEQLLDTLGVKLVAGRNFRADEIGKMGSRDFTVPPVVIVSRTLADRLFPRGEALGKPIYMMSNTPSTIIGIVDRLQRQNVGGWTRPYAYQSMLWPMRPVSSQGLYYIVRAKPGQLAAAMREAPKALYAEDRMRIIDPEHGTLSFAEVRRRIYDSDLGMAILMGLISVVLLAITAAGIVGLTSFWVGQRRKQIGVRRALGATRRDILGYFLTENLLIGLGGVLVGTVLAIGINLWMVTQFEMARLSLAYVMTGVVALLLLGQGAVLGPALRASRVSPVEATRSV
ncbi:peptide ABC transporter permease [Rhodanobacter sp. Soil772]|uniref:ABC transporter permease n=1 Tax=Rhodanobacter sp. Soil772 TaxID=1736406 RepID=UPI0006F396C5|nr:FtsX-like permease family protein [Rhodanobacter sp. Soil772]KRE85431.1 peptide ABC transporter permease [Rhodanobacter sp. Soil772]